MSRGKGRIIGIAVAILIIALMFGCTQENAPQTGEKKDPNVIKYTQKECHNVTTESTECWEERFRYSAEPMDKIEPYKMDIFCVGGGSLTVSNLERKSGVFKVTFTFNTELEGQVTKTVEKEIGPKISETFEEKTQFRCGQEFGVEAKVTAPMKKTCGLVNKTQEECIVR